MSLVELGDGNNDQPAMLDQHTDQVGEIDLVVFVIRPRVGGARILRWLVH